MRKIVFCSFIAFLFVFLFRLYAIILLMREELLALHLFSLMRVASEGVKKKEKKYIFIQRVFFKIK